MNPLPSTVQDSNKTALLPVLDQLSKNLWILLNRGDYKRGQLKNMVKRNSTVEDALRVLIDSDVLTVKEKEKFVIPMRTEVERIQQMQHPDSHELVIARQNLNTIYFNWKTSANHDRGYRGPSGRHRSSKMTTHNIPLS